MPRLAGALLIAGVAIAICTGTADAKQKPGFPTVGSVITTGRVTVKLRAYQQPVAGDLTIAAIDVEVCNRTTTTQTVAPYQFFLQTPGHPLAFPAKGVPTPSPQLQALPLAGHACERGWVSYEVTAGIRVRFVVFQAGAMFTPTLHKWRVGRES